MKKLIKVSFRYFQVLIILFSISCSTPDEEVVIQAYFDAHNEHDIKKAMSYYHDEIEFELKGTWIKSGKDEILTLETWDSTLNSHLKLESISIKGDTIFCKVIENNDWFDAAGITDLIHDPTTFIMENGKIRKVIAVPSKETSMQIGKVIQTIVNWSQETQDSTIYELLPEGQFLYSSDAALKWLDLIGRWQTSNEQNNKSQ